MKTLVLLLLLATPAAAAVPAYDTQAVAAPDRPPADTARDAARHTLALLVFSTVKPADRVIDFVPGTGFFTRLFSRAVGPRGHVFAVTPREFSDIMPGPARRIAALAAQPAYSNVTAAIEPTAEVGTAALAQGGPVDVVWTSDNYHDIAGFFGAGKAAAADAAIFRALKPGGLYVVIDHAAAAGADIATGKTLHRIDPQIVKAQVLAAGFVLDATTDVLANPADPHTATIFDPAIKGHTDQFAFRFRKPAR